jgi:hypothetical protein
MEKKIEIGDCFIKREQYAFTVSKVVGIIGVVYKTEEIYISVADGEIDIDDAYGFEDYILGTKIDSKVYDAIKGMATRMFESIKQTETKTFERMLSYLEETVGDI